MNMLLITSTGAHENQDGQSPLASAKGSKIIPTKTPS